MRQRLRVLKVAFARAQLSPDPGGAAQHPGHRARAGERAGVVEEGRGFVTLAQRKLRLS